MVERLLRQFRGAPSGAGRRVIEMVQDDLGQKQVGLTVVRVRHQVGADLGNSLIELAGVNELDRSVERRM
jgi:hypothetical protein